MQKELEHEDKEDPCQLIQSWNSERNIYLVPIYQVNLRYKFICQLDA